MKLPEAEQESAGRLEEQLVLLDKLHALEDQMQFDVWAQPVETFGKSS